MTKDIVVADAMMFSTLLTKREFGVQAQAKALHQEYRQGAMDASIKILTALNLTEIQYDDLMKTLGVMNDESY